MAAEDRAQVFQAQAIQLLKKLGKEQQRQDQREEELEALHVQNIKEVTTAAAATAAEVHEREREWAAILAVSAPLDHGYSLKLRLLRKMYEKAGSTRHFLETSN